MFRIEVNYASAQEALAKLSPEVERKMRRGVSRALAGAKRDARQAVKQEFTYKGAIKGLRTRNGGLSGELRAVGGKHKLKHFNVQPRKRINKRGVYLQSEVRRGQRRKLSKAFWHNSAVMERTGASRLPIQAKFGASTPEMLSTSAGRELIMRGIERRLMEAFV